MLSLLQGRRRWTGAELAERLEVSPRTVRGDIERLRDLGYSVAAARGGAGGYRLGAGGADVPPLLLDADEAVAVAIGLRSGMSCIIGGMEETSLQALTKVERLLPARVRHRLRNLDRFLVPLPFAEPAPVVDPRLLTMLVELCRGCERLRFDEHDRQDTAAAPGRREIEPYRVINRGNRWYLFGYDLGIDEWRVFPVERIVPRTPTGPRFRERELPGDLEDFVARLLPTRTWNRQATVVVHAPADVVAERIAPAEGELSVLDDSTCRAVVGGQTILAIAAVLARLDADFAIEDSPDLARCLAELSDRYAHAAASHEYG
nr:WYL domain-containing protein [Rhodococcus sp. HNM0569]